jgi:PAS domain S-box-containing protein/putative nucleotidyltransferase with HDIG domain
MKAETTVRALNEDIIQPPATAVDAGSPGTEIRTLMAGVHAFFEQHAEDPDLLHLLQLSNLNQQQLEHAFLAWRAVFDAVRDPIFVHDAEFRLTRINQAYAELAGMPIKTALGRPYWEVFPKMDGPSKGCEIIDNISTAKGAECDEIVLEDGRTFQSRAFVMQDTQGRFMQVVQILHDVTSQKQTLAALKENQEKLQIISDFAQDAIIVLDDEGLIQFWNPAAEKMYGYTASEILGKPLHELLVDAEQLSLFRHGQSEFKNTGKGPMIGKIAKLAGRRKDGSTIVAEHSVSAVNIQGRWHAIGMARDITERHNMEIMQARHAEQLAQSLRNTVLALVRTLEKRDPYTAGHQQRVAELSSAIGREMGLSDHQIKGIHLGALIHDIGKIYIPFEILNRPGKLTSEEFMLIKTHPTVGHEIIADTDFPWPIADMILQHHERMDGTGYPAGLRGNDIILEARIIGVADVVEAMSVHRPYRPSLGIEKALTEVTRTRGTSLDPAVVDACLTLFNESRFSFSAIG